MTETSAKTPPKSEPVEKPAEVDPPKFQPKYNWMNKTRGWGVRALPGKAGLKLGDLNLGIYGEIPMEWDDQTRNPRGAVPRRGMPPVGYAIRDKAGLWADCAADLYEEAIQRRWAPATDVPWASIKPLPDDVEHAVCQVCTELSQYANVDIETITGWQHQMSYGYHEVKQYLATASFDAARHYECFRKRALVNGGGLGLEGPGQVNRMILESRGGWTEAVVYLFLVRGVFTMTLYRYLGRYAHNDAERFIYGHALADKARQMTYALDHIRFAIAHLDDQRQVAATLPCHRRRRHGPRLPRSRAEGGAGDHLRGRHRGRAPRRHGGLPRPDARFPRNPSGVLPLAGYSAQPRRLPATFERIRGCCNRWLDSPQSIGSMKSARCSTATRATTAPAAGNAIAYGA